MTYNKKFSDSLAKRKRIDDWNLLANLKKAVGPILIDLPS
jgi:hypothetical protein